MEANDKRIKKYIPEIIRFLPTCRDNQQRELLKILSLMDIDEEHESILFNNCVNIWKKLKKQPSLRYKAFKMMVKVTTKYPDFYCEIELLTQIQYIESLSPAAKNGISRMLREMKPE